MRDLILLQEWVKGHLPNCVNLNTPILLDQINSDAGFRQYFRINSKPSLIAVFLVLGLDSFRDPYSML